MDIKNIAYNLYKIDWTSRVPKEERMRAFQEYCVSGSKLTFDDWILQNGYKNYGYGNRIYVGFEEFVKAIYIIKSYMIDILGDKHLIEMYKQDIMSN